MPRDSSGTYSLPAGSLVNTGDTLLVSQHNPPFQDLANAITKSLDRDGSGGMRADLAMNGNKVTGVAPGVNPGDVATVDQIGESVSVPIGSVLDFWGSTPPDGYLFAAGQEVSRASYAALFAVIGTNAGAGDGSTTFNLPDYRGRIGAGRENMATPATARLNTLSSSTLGAAGGAQTHTLTSAQMPVHSHNVTDPGHTHAGGGSNVGPTNPRFLQDGPDYGNGPSSAVSSNTTGISIANAGGGGAHNNVQPTLIVNKIIRVT